MRQNVFTNIASDTQFIELSKDTCSKHLIQLQTPLPLSGSESHGYDSASKSLKSISRSKCIVRTSLFEKEQVITKKTGPALKIMKVNTPTPRYSISHPLLCFVELKVLKK